MERDQDAGPAYPQTSRQRQVSMHSRPALAGSPSWQDAVDPQQTKASRASANKNVAILKCSAEGWTDLHGASLGLER
jgi:hypothetical protein